MIAPHAPYVDRCRLWLLTGRVPGRRRRGQLFRCPLQEMCSIRMSCQIGAVFGVTAKQDTLWRLLAGGG